MLTDAKAKNAKPKDKAYKLSDSGGMYLEVMKTGAKYWRWKYRFAGKEKRLAIGVYPDITLLEARSVRDRARELLVEGVDPSLHKQLEKRRKQASTDTSFASIAVEWLRVHASDLAPSTAARKNALLENDILPYLGTRPVEELETFELVGCLNRIADRGAIETAHRARNIINQICRFAKQTGRLKHNPASDLVGALPPIKQSHMAAITDPAEFGRLLVAIDQYEGTHIIRTALRLAPLLFQRPGELCAMEWQEVDFESQVWVIPIEKKKERNQIQGDHVVPLCSQAMELLRDIQPITGHGALVFPNQRNHGNPIRTESLNKAIRLLGYDTKTQHCAHGFRAAARTLLDEQLQLRVEWIEQQLAHKVKDTLGNAYNRTKYMPERVDMMQRWADYLDELKRQTLAGNVITHSFAQRS